jgi:Domain of unknown function (DUF6602)
MRKDFKGRDGIYKQEELVRELKRQIYDISGLDNTFSSIEEKMQIDFKATSTIKHPGDKGTSRENVLKSYIIENNMLPARYSISKGSSHIVSTTGHKSAQCDMVIYDTLNTPSLFDVGEIQYFPIESVYGIIELKSNLNSRKTIHDGLSKIASFKKLRKSMVPLLPARSGNSYTQGSRGFGVLFAYDASLEWMSILGAIKDFQKEHKGDLWPNLVVILNQAIIFQMNERNITCIASEDIDNLQETNLFGVPGEKTNLLNFYLVLMDLLSSTRITLPPMRKYANLPNTAGEHSYDFMSVFQQTGRCNKHGDYHRSISNDNIDKIIKACKGTKPINWIQATDIAYGEKGDNFEAYEKQPGNVLIYNPENIPLPDVLLIEQEFQGKKTKALGFENLRIDGKAYFVPYYYLEKEALVEKCPQCPKVKKVDMSIEEWKLVMNKDN